jgi:hypothetical protein
MTPARFNKLVRRELDGFLRDGRLASEVHARLAALYPAARWDWLGLGRWFAVFGALSAVAGAGLLAREVFEFTLERLALLLGAATLAAVTVGVRLGRGGYRWSGHALELAAGLCLVGLTFTLGVLYSTGSGNWPALLLIDLCLLLPLAYLRVNPLQLTLALVLFFTWFGGVTGYVSGWGMYWFSMNFPLRFLLVGLLIVLFALAHRYAEQGGALDRYRGFFKLWLAAGLFFAEMALWLLALFGNFGDFTTPYREGPLERLVFNLLWAGLNLGLLWLGQRLALRQARGFALTFLTIQGYTLYFEFVAGVLGGVFGLLVAGVVTLWLVRRLELPGRLRQARGAARG